MSKARVVIWIVALLIIGVLLVGCGQEPRPEPTIVRLPTTTPTPAIPAPTSTPTPTSTAPPPASTPTSTPTPTSVSAPSNPRSQSPTPTPTPGLQGRFVFQAASGGDIYTVNADGTNLSRLTSGMDPSWSPDGRQIAFSRWTTPWGIYTANADGSNERLLFSSDVARTPIWSPDGSQIAFYFQTQGFTAPVQICIPGGLCIRIPPQLQTEWHLGVVDVADGYFRQPYNDRFSFAPAWSTDGEWILYDGDHGLSMTTVEGPNNRVFTENVHDHFPVTSPDGTRIAFMHWQHDHWEIYVMNADGSGRWPLTSSSALLERRPNNVSPAWSPDGEQLVFLSDRGGEWEFYVMNADGSNQRKILEGVTQRLSIQYNGVNERVISWTR
jgi:TolB protein